MDIVSGGEIGSRRSDLADAARTNTQSQRKRRKQEESEYAPALAVTDIVTECDKARERRRWNWIILLQGLRPTWDSDSTRSEQLLKTNYKINISQFF